MSSQNIQELIDAERARRARVEAKRASIAETLQKQHEIQRAANPQYLNAIRKGVTEAVAGTVDVLEATGRALGEGHRASEENAIRRAQGIKEPTPMDVAGMRPQLGDVLRAPMQEFKPTGLPEKAVSNVARLGTETVLTGAGVGRGPRAIAGEVGSAAGAAAGATAAGEMAPDSTATQVIGEIVGAIMGGNRAQRMAGGLSSREKELSAQFKDFLGEDAVDSVEDALDAADQIPGSEFLSVPERTENLKLLKLERDLRTKNADYELEVKARRADLEDKLQTDFAKQLEVAGDPSTTRAYLVRVTREADKIVTDRLDAAQEQATAAIAELATSASGTGQRLSMADANRVVAETLLQARKDLWDQEDAIWANVKSTVMVDTGAARRTLVRMAQEGTEEFGIFQFAPGKVKRVPDAIATEVQTEQVNPLTGAIEMVTRLDDMAPAKTVQNARRVINDALREAQLGGRPAEASMLQQISKDLKTALEGADPATTDPESARAYAEAIAFTREIHDRFSGGRDNPIAGVMKRDFSKRSRTIEQVAPGNLREGFESLDKATAPVSDEFDELNRALTMSRDSIDSATKDHLRDQFAVRFVTDGKVTNVNGARQWLKNNEDVLRLFPKEKTQIVDAIQTQTASESLLKKVTIKSKEREQRGAAAIFFKGKDTETVVAEVMRKSTSLNDVLALRRLIAKDPDALGGLRAGVLGYVSKQMIANGTTPLVERAPQMARWLKANEEKLNIILAPHQKKFLERMHRTVSLTTGAERARTLPGSSNTASDVYTDILARFAGAKVGVLLASGSVPSLIAAGAGARIFRGLNKGFREKASAKILRRAFNDSEYFQRLIEGDPAVLNSAATLDILATVLEGKDE